MNVIVNILWLFFLPPVVWWAWGQWEQIINSIMKSYRNPTLNSITTIKFTDPPTETQS